MENERFLKSGNPEKIIEELKIESGRELDADISDSSEDMMLNRENLIKKQSIDQILFRKCKNNQIVHF